jgi:hypothetical protein
MNDEAKKITDVMRILGSRRSERKAESSRRNSLKTRFQSKPLHELECTCGKCPDDPKTYCPRGRAIRRRLAKGQPLE